MRFYNRQSELAELNRLYQQADDTSRMTVLTGRRRVGKTLLATEFANKHPHVYLFVAKKSEPLLCEEFLTEIQANLTLPLIGEIKTFQQVFQLLLEVSKKERITVIIDEFQQFYNINPSVFSDIQKLWDRHKAQCKLNLIMIGSVYSLMHKIFQNEKEPLFGRADRLLKIKPFTIETQQHILADYRLTSAEQVFDYYLFTGGMPRYMDILLSNAVDSREKLLNFILHEFSPFLNEGRNVLIEEFGRNYSVYFSILELLACGKTSRNEMESVLQKNIGGHLERLEHDYAVINKHKPLNAKPNSKLQKYKIIDNFLNFWFRFIYRHRSAIESENFNYVKAIIERDYATYSGIILERYYHDLYRQRGCYTQIGQYWERGNQNEIDMVAVEEPDKTLTVADIKLNAERIDLTQLKAKANQLLKSYPGYQVQWIGLSLADVIQTKTISS